MKKYLLWLVIFFISYSVGLWATVDIKLSSQKITLGEPIKVTIITSKPIKKYKIILDKKRFKLF